MDVPYHEVVIAEKLLFYSIRFCMPNDKWSCPSWLRLPLYYIQSVYYAWYAMLYTRNLRIQASTWRQHTGYSLEIELALLLQIGFNYFLKEYSQFNVFLFSFLRRYNMI